MPTLFVLHLVHWFRGTRVIVDWHNLGYSILALNVQGGDDHPLVRVARWYVIGVCLSYLFRDIYFGTTE